MLSKQKADTFHEMIMTIDDLKEKLEENPSPHLFQPVTLYVLNSLHRVCR